MHKIEQSGPATAGCSGRRVTASGPGWVTRGTSGVPGGERARADGRQRTEERRARNVGSTSHVVSKSHGIYVGSISLVVSKSHGIFLIHLLFELKM